MSQQPAGKKKAIIAYITIIGMFIAMSMNSDNKDVFATRHIQNMFGLSLLWVISQIVTNVMNAYAGDALWFLVLILTVYSVIRAIQGRLPNIPVLSNAFAKWFSFLD